MRVAEHRHAVRAEIQRLLVVSMTDLHRLQRQAVHQVDVERIDAHGAQALGDAFGHFVALHAAHGLLHRRREILHAEAGAGHAHFGQRHQPVLGKWRGSSSTAISASSATSNAPRSSA